MTEDTGVWAYAITEDSQLNGPDGPVDLSWLCGVAEAKVRTVACSGLTVLVSDVSLAEFGEAALRRNLGNLDWLDEVAREHHYVIDAAARMFPLLPTRLATVYSGDAAVCAALADRRGRLRGALRRVGGRVEWGVKAYAKPEPGEADAVRTPGESTGAGTGGNTKPRTGSTESGGETGGAGLAYLKRRRAQLTAGQEARVGAGRGGPAPPAAVRSAQRSAAADAAQRRLPGRRGRRRELHRGGRGPGNGTSRAAGRADRSLAAVLVRRR